MRVFLSWSGNRSRYVAEKFSEWLPVVIQSVDTFMSQHDVDAGSRWAREIDDQLEETDFGILFVTPENQEEPWLVHEAGALGKSVEESRVVPVTIQMEPADVGWPLARFQGVNLGEDGVRDLINSVNSALGEKQLESSVLERAFDTNWPRLQEDLEDIPPLSEGASTEEDTLEEAQRKRDKKIDEVLELVRSMVREGRGYHPPSTEHGEFTYWEMLVDGPDESLENLPERLEKVGKNFGIPFSAVLEPGEDHYRLVLYGGGINHDNFLQLGDAVTKEIEGSDVEIL
jgi:hypothetical protein